MNQGITITVNAESEAAAAKLKEFFDSAIEGIDHMAKASEFLEEIAGKLIAAFSVGAIVEFTREAINAAEAVGRLSRQVGFSVQALSALKEVANANAIQFEELRLGLTHFNSVMNDARVNGGQAMQSFRNLSQEIAVAVAQGRPAEEVYRMIAERFKEMPDGIQKTSAAQALFGRSSSQWVTLLNEGAEEMERLKALNGGITPEAVAQATAFNRTLRELHDQLEKIFQQFSSQILPTLQQMVNWLKALTQEADAVHNSVTGLVDIFKGLITVGVVVGTLFVDLGKTIGFIAAEWVEAFETAYTIIQQIAAQIKNIFSDIVALMKDSVMVFVAAQQAMQLAMVGRFGDARTVIKTELAGIRDDINALGTHAAAAFGGIPTEILKLIGKVSEMDADFAVDIITQWTKVSNFLSGLWAPTVAKAKPPGVPGSSASGADAGGATTAGDQDKLNAARLEYDRDKIQLQEKVIETDPTLTQAERLRKLLPLLIQEKGLLSDQIAQQKIIANDPSRTDLEKVAANREIVKLQAQQLLISRQMVQAVRPWLTSLGGAMAHLKEMNNLAQQTAQSFESVFNNAISSISENLTKVIEGTESWGEALRNIGSAILNEIINAIVTMAVRWIITSVMMAAFGEALIASTAAVYSAAWAGPAILSTIASYGAAAAAAGPEVMGALAFTPLIAAAAREHGGPANAGQLIMAGERGRELIVPRADSQVFNAADTARLVDFARNGSSKGGSASASPVNIRVHFQDDPQRTEKEVRDNPNIHHIIVDVAKRHAHQIQPRA